MRPPPHDVLAPQPDQPEPGRIFDMQPLRLTPAEPPWLSAWAFPASVHLGRAHGSRPSARIAMLVHGFAMNEDYFGLLAPELIARGYDVWAVRLPGYASSGDRPSRFTPLHHGLSVGFYAWIVASALAHVRSAAGRPARVLAWGHSLGAAALVSALATHGGLAGCGIDRLVLEAPAFREVLAIPASWIAVLTMFPSALLNVLGRALFIDDLRSSDFAERQSTPFVPGRSSRLMLTLNALALANPLTATPRLSDEARERAWFVMAEFDRLVDHDRLAALLDDWAVPAERRLVLPRNHLLALSSAPEMVAWIERGS